MSYYNGLVDVAVDAISDFGDFEWFVSDDPYVKQYIPTLETPPWKMQCGRDSCEDCSEFVHIGSKMSCKSGYDISDLETLNNE